MPALIIITISIFPTLLVYSLLNKVIRSTYLKLSFSWFGGQYILAIFTFMIAIMLSLTELNGILQKALIISLVSILIISLIVYKRISSIIGNDIKNIKLNTKTLCKIGFLVLIFLFSFYFYKPHLILKNGNIYTSPVYWDFWLHAPLIQNFVYGNNFPPQNEVFAGLPATYHFFFDFLVSIYSSAGLNLVSSLNYASITSLSFLLVTIMGFGEEFFKSFWVGILAVFLTITSSSLHFLDYFKNILGKENGLQIIKNIVHNTTHPASFSLIPGNPFGYNGMMFNMFYFLEERQIVIGVIFLIFFFWLVYKRDKLTNAVLVIIGALAGLYFLWHLFITIIALCALLFLFVFDKNRRKTLFLLIPFSFVFILHVLYFKRVTNSMWFYPTIKNFPKISFNFPTMGEKYPFSILHTIGYYAYGYGFKIVFLILGLSFLKKKNKRLFMVFLSIIVPTFIMINTIQLSPASIYDNHKWLKPMNVIIDFLAAFSLYQIFTYKKKVLAIMVGIISFALITISGFIELMPFLNSKPTTLYANYQSPLISSIRVNTRPQSIFLTRLHSHYAKGIQLAGRKLFLSNDPGQSFMLRRNLRKRIIKEIYSSTNLNSFCSLTKKYNIDYVEMTGINILTTKPFTKLNINQGTKQISFVDIDKSCR